MSSRNINANPPRASPNLAAHTDARASAAVLRRSSAARRWLPQLAGPLAGAARMTLRPVVFDPRDGGDLFARGGSL